jgi:hypothetical protein
MKGGTISKELYNIRIRPGYNCTDDMQQAETSKYIKHDQGLGVFDFKFAYVSTVCGETSR